MVKEGWCLSLMLIKASQLIEISLLVWKVLKLYSRCCELLLLLMEEGCC